jgi:hypothetical protein
MKTIDSCHSHWMFDTDRHRFLRILRNPELGPHPVTTEWRPYSALHVWDQYDSFLVVLNDSGTKMLRAWRHREGNCPNCGLKTGEVSVFDGETSVMGAARRDPVRTRVMVRLASK